jgi:hypothetical protein
MICMNRMKRFCWARSFGAVTDMVMAERSGMVGESCAVRPGSAMSLDSRCESRGRIRATTSPSACPNAQNTT